MPLLEGLDGVQKMSKSLGNYVGINKPAKDIFGKLMSISDELMYKYCELLTDEDVRKIKEDVQGGKLHPKEAKVNLAKIIVRQYHGDKEALHQAKVADINLELAPGKEYRIRVGKKFHPSFIKEEINKENEMRLKNPLRITAVTIIVLTFLLCYFAPHLEAKRWEKASSSPAHFWLMFHNERFDLLKSLGCQGIRRPEFVFARYVSKEGKAKSIISYYDSLEQKGLVAMVTIRTGKSKVATRCRPYQVKTSYGNIFAPPLPNPRADYSCPPKDMKKYHSCVYDLVSGLSGRVNLFIIENEVNSPSFWYGTKEEYVELRRTAYEAAHAANPKVTIIDNGFDGFGWGVVITRDLLEAGREEEAVRFANDYFTRKSDKPINRTELKERMYRPQNCYIYDFIKYSFQHPDFDVTSYHFYAPSKYQKTVIDWIRNEMRKNGYDKPIWASEGGVHDPGNRFTPAEIADEVVKLHVVGFAETKGPWVYLPMIEGESGTLHISFKGLYNSSLNLIAAGKAYKIMTEKIGDFSQVERCSLSGVDAYKFIVGDTAVYVAWSDSPLIADFTAEAAGPLRITTTSGESYNVDSRSLKLTSSPIFIEFFHKGDRN